MAPTSPSSFMVFGEIVCLCCGAPKQAGMERNSAGFTHRIVANPAILWIEIPHSFPTFNASRLICCQGDHFFVVLYYGLAKGSSK
jgi:hypothetical protein